MLSLVYLPNSLKENVVQRLRIYLHLRFQNFSFFFLFLVAIRNGLILILKKIVTLLFFFFFHFSFYPNFVEYDNGWNERKIISIELSI
jgi:hypothetical protein